MLARRNRNRVYVFLWVGAVASVCVLSFFAAVPPRGERDWVTAEAQNRQSGDHSDVNRPGTRIQQHNNRKGVSMELSENEVKTKNLYYSETLHIGKGRGLYYKRGSTPVVIELKDHSELDSLIRSGLMSVVAFYAPWCGHCQHLVKPYTRMASALQRTNDVTIAALSCEASPKGCAKYKIRAYPSFFAYGFSRDSRSDDVEGQLISSGVKGVEEYIQKNAFLYKDLDGSKHEWQRHPHYEGLFMSKKRDNFAAEWLNGTLVSRERDARGTVSPLDRLQDGISSVQYLLLNELPLILTEFSSDSAPIESAHEFVMLLLALLPSSEVSLQAKRRSLEEIAAVLKDNGADEKKNDDRNKQVAAALSDIRALGSIKWSVCGLSTSSASVPCGLWMIMHFVTVATELSPASFREWCARGGIQRRSPRSLTDCTAHVAAVLNDLIRHLFRCRSCAHHFVDSYNTCEHRRPGCSPEKDGPLPTQGLQMWLFQVHNDVTKRIFRGLDETYDTKKSKLPFSNVDMVAWPSGFGIDISNHQDKHLSNESSALKYLQRAYHDREWG